MVVIEPDTQPTAASAPFLDFPRIHSFEDWLHAPAPLESVHPRFDIRRAVPAEFDRIYTLVNEGFGLQRMRARYDWMYRRNPYGPARCWLAFDRQSERLVGNWTGFPWPMARGAQFAEGCQMGDLVIAQGWQRHGIGRLCTEVARSHAWQGKSLVFSWPNDNSRAFLAKYGRAAEALGPAPKAVLILNAQKYLADRRLPPFVSALAGRAIDGALTGWSRLLMRRDWGLRIETVRRFESAFDEVTRRCMTWSGIWSPHKSEFLNWRYFEDPSSECVAFALLKGVNVEGYYVLKIDGHASWLMEFVAPVLPRSFTSTLLLHLIATARAAGCNRIRFSAPPGWRHWMLFHAVGFLPLPSDIYILPWLNDEEPERAKLSAWQWVPGDMDGV